MNSISPNTSALSILKEQQVKSPCENESSSIDTQDKLVKSDDKKIDFKKITLPKLDENTKTKMLQGGTIGALVGGLAGGITAYNMAWHEIKAEVPSNSVELAWQEPVTNKESIGKIPSNYYSFIKWSKTHNRPCTENVWVVQPAVDNAGRPVMQDVSKTFEGYGNYTITQKNNNINYQTLNGYYERVIEDSHTHTETDSKGNTRTTKHIDGYWHRFSPNISNTKIGEYQTPVVKFDNGGINVGLRTLAGVGIGAGIGAVAGAITGAAIAYAQNKNE